MKSDKWFDYSITIISIILTTGLIPSPAGDSNMKIPVWTALLFVIIGTVSKHFPKESGLGKITTYLGYPYLIALRIINEKFHSHRTFIKVLIIITLLTFIILPLIMDYLYNRKLWPYSYLN